MVSVTAPPYDPNAKRRAAIRRRRRERQILVFGLILVGLAFTGLFFASVYRGDVDGPFSAPFVTPESEFETDVNIACPPSGAMPLPPTEVALRVMNATETAGLAGTTADDLEGRGFVVVDATNYSRPYTDAVQILYGEEGLVQAYTVSTYFTEFEMVLDSRDSAVVDVILGDAYGNGSLRPQDAPELSLENPLVRPQQCVPIELVVPVPAPRNIPENPLATASPEPSESPSPEPSSDD